MSGEIPSLVDLQNTKVRIDHFAELIDGTPSGTSTNPITGVTHPTYEKAIKDLGFNPGSGSFTTGFTLNPGEYDVAWYDPVSNNWYSWGGVIPTGGMVVAPGTDPTAVTGYVPRTDVVLREEIKPSENVSALLSRSVSVGKTYRTLRTYPGVHRSDCQQRRRPVRSNWLVG